MAIGRPTIAAIRKPPSRWTSTRTRTSAAAALLFSQEFALDSLRARRTPRRRHEGEHLVHSSNLCGGEVITAQRLQVWPEFLVDLRTEALEDLGQVHVVPDERLGHGHDGLVTGVGGVHPAIHLGGKRGREVGGDREQVVRVADAHAVPLVQENAHTLVAVSY